MRYLFYLWHFKYEAVKYPVFFTLFCDPGFISLFYVTSFNGKLKCLRWFYSLVKEEVLYTYKSQKYFHFCYVFSSMSIRCRASSKYFQILWLFVISISKMYVRSFLSLLRNRLLSFHYWNINNNILINMPQK